MKTLAILGSTGSVGSQTLSVLSRNPNKYDVSLLVANTNWRLLEDQIRAFKPRWAVMVEEKAANELKKRVRDLSVEVFTGSDSITELLETGGFNLVVAAMVGYAGLAPVIAAIKSGADIALANKEVLVMAGHLVTALCQRSGVQLIPLDSEHSAIFQCLQGYDLEAVNKIILTASGGPFLGKSLAELATVTPHQALKHPNWNMGAKISVDSATLMNKGLEIIEASWLFQIPQEKIDVLIHPQSIVHSMVEFNDGAVLAQLGVRSMEVPIQLALSWPERWQGAKDNFIDWLGLPALNFSLPDTNSFPCLDLARKAFHKGGNAPAVLSTANEVCVEQFLLGKLTFNEIPQVIDRIMETIPWQGNPDLGAVVESVENTIMMTKIFIENME